MTTATQALKEARHELTTLHGLWASNSASDDGTHHPEEQVWLINATETINKIEQALAVSERSLSERIEAAYDEAISQRERMLEAQGEIRRAEENVKVEHSEEWAGAKNGDVRKVLLAEWLAHDDPYVQARIYYDRARDSYRLYLLEIERLKLLVALEGAQK